MNLLIKRLTLHVSIYSRVQYHSSSSSLLQLKAHIKLESDRRLTIDMGKSKKAVKFYAVHKGYKCDVFDNWLDCQKQINGYKGAVYKSFLSRQEALDFMKYGNHKIYGEHSRKNTTSTADIDIHRVFAEKRSLDVVEDETVFVKKIKQNSGSLMIEQASSGLKYNKDIGIHVDMQTGHVVFFTDGSCLGNQNMKFSHRRAGYGIFAGLNSVYNRGEVLVDTQPSNNKAELLAAIKALEMMPEIQSKHNRNIFEIRSDSEYTINTATRWAKKWEKNGWKSSTGKAPTNLQYAMHLKYLLDSISEKGIKVKWTYVPAHKGHFGNEEADELAKSGARKLNKSEIVNSLPCRSHSKCECKFI